MDYQKKLFDTLEKSSVQSNIGNKFDIEDLKNIFKTAKKNSHQIFFIGNGGSAAIAEHMSVDFLKNGRMRTVSMFAPPTLTCLANDYGYEYVFSKQLEFLANENDLLVAISSSGNSPNIVNAVNKAIELKMKVLTFSGFDSDNKISHSGDYNLYVPSHEYGTVESIHNLILQQIVDEIKSEEEKN